MPGKIKTVIFDIDNTLYSFAKADGAALEALALYAWDHFGWTAEEFYRRHQAARKALIDRMGYSGSCRSRILRFQALLEEAGQPYAPHALAMYDLYWSTLLERMEPYEGAADVLRVLKERGVRIGIGTDMTAFMQFRKLEKLGVLSYVDFMVSSEEAGEEKPSRTFFQKCAEKSRCLPEECLFIGDSPEKDYRGACAFGMHALLFAEEELPSGDNGECLMIIRDLRDILNYPGIREVS